MIPGWQVQWLGKDHQYTHTYTLAEVMLALLCIQVAQVILLELFLL